MLRPMRQWLELAFHINDVNEFIGFVSTLGGSHLAYTDLLPPNLPIDLTYRTRAGPGAR